MIRSVRGVGTTAELVNVSILPGRYSAPLTVIDIDTVAGPKEGVTNTAESAYDKPNIDTYGFVDPSAVMAITVINMRQSMRQGGQSSPGEAKLVNRGITERMILSGAAKGLDASLIMEGGSNGSKLRCSKAS